MNLIKIGDTVLNADRIDGIQDHLHPSDSSATGHHKTIRVLFDHGSIDLTGEDAKVLRRWYRHVARDLAPHKDEDGEELASPERQLREVFDALLNLIDRARPRDPLLRSTAHGLADMVDRYITGELEPMRISQLERLLSDSNPEAASHPDSPPA